MVQKSAKETIKEADKTTHKNASDRTDKAVNVVYMNPDISIEKHAYIIPHPNVFRDDKDVFVERKVAMLTP
jgi:hypothetical protein